MRWIFFNIQFRTFLVHLKKEISIFKNDRRVRTLEKTIHQISSIASHSEFLDAETKLKKATFTRNDTLEIDYHGKHIEQCCHLIDMQSSYHS